MRLPVDAFEAVGVVRYRVLSRARASLRNRRGFAFIGVMQGADYLSLILNERFLPEGMVL